MKLSFKTLVAVALVTLATAGGPAAGGEPAKKSIVPPAPVRSEFRQPANPREGRDPFYPGSTRPYESAVATNRPVEVTSLFVKGFSGTPGHELVIINNHTFAPGDAKDVTGPSGRVHVRCVEIRPHTVVVEVNGQKRELNFGSK